jgi:hypothetical protein
MAISQRRHSSPKTGRVPTRGEIAQIREDRHGLVVGLWLCRGDEAVHLAPDRVLLADQGVEVPVPGERRVAFQAGLVAGSLFAGDPAPLRS